MILALIENVELLRQLSNYRSLVCTAVLVVTTSQFGHEFGHLCILNEVSWVRLVISNGSCIVWWQWSKLCWDVASAVCIPTTIRHIIHHLRDKTLTSHFTTPNTSWFENILLFDCCCCCRRVLHKCLVSIVCSKCFKFNKVYK